MFRMVTIASAKRANLYLNLIERDAIKHDKIILMIQAYGKIDTANSGDISGLNTKTKRSNIHSENKDPKPIKNGIPENRLIIPNMRSGTPTTCI